MSDTLIESFEHNGKTVEIHWDSDPVDVNPRKFDGNLGIMVCEHRDYYLGDQPERGKSSDIEEYDDLKRAMLHYGQDRGKIALFDRYCRIYHGTTAIMPLYLLDHSGLAMRVSRFMEDPGGWDTSFVGFILDTAKTREETGAPEDKVEEGLRSEVKVYDQYLQGEVYGYVINDEDGDEEDSCWGFLGDQEYVKQSARDAAGYTCKHCNQEITRNLGPIVDPDPEDPRAWAHHRLCKVCHTPVAWGKEGCYHTALDVTLADHHAAQSEIRRGCVTGDTFAEPAQPVERGYE